MAAEDQWEAVAGRVEPAIAALGLQAIERLRGMAPGATEQVYDNYNALVVGFASGEKASDAVLSIAFYPRWVTLFFLQGASLDDPAGQLEGKGATVRSIRLTAAGDLDRPEVRALVGQALERARTPIDPHAPRRLLIKSVSAAQRSRRP